MRSTTPTVPSAAAASEIIAPGDDSIQVVARLRPFNTELTERRYPAGMSLGEVLEDLQPKPLMRACSHVSIGGERISRELLHRVRPKPGTHVSITTVPRMGGGGKNPLRFILMLAVLVASVVLTYGLTTPIAVGSAVTVGQVAGAVFHRSGSILIGAFLTARSGRRRA